MLIVPLADAGMGVAIETTRKSNVIGNLLVFFALRVLNSPGTTAAQGNPNSHWPNVGQWGYREDLFYKIRLILICFTEMKLGGF